MNKRRRVYAISAGFLISAVLFGMYQFGRSIKIRSVLAADRVAYTIWYRDATYMTNRGGDINYDNPHNSVTTLKARQSTGSTAEVSFLSYSSPTDFKIGARRLHSVADAE